jgi:hypothetical protein
VLSCSINVECFHRLSLHVQVCVCVCVYVCVCVCEVSRSLNQIVSGKICRRKLKPKYCTFSYVVSGEKLIGIALNVIEGLLSFELSDNQIRHDDNNLTLKTLKEMKLKLSEKSSIILQRIFH